MPTDRSKPNNPFNISQDIINKCIEDVKKYENEQLNQTEQYTDTKWKMSTVTTDLDEDELECIRRSRSIKRN